MEGVTFIESSLSTRQGDPLGGPLFSFAHYQSFLKTIARAPIYVFPSIMGPMSEIAHAFDHLLTHLTLIGLKVKM